MSKEITVGGKTYTINKFRPVEGRRIVAGYPLTAIPKIGDYDKNEELMIRLMSYVQVHLVDGNKQALTTQALIDNHTESWDALMELEYEVLKYNCKFLQEGGMKSIGDFVKDVASNYLFEIIAMANSKAE